MTFPFNAAQGLIVVDAETRGPLGNQVIRVALDTGARRTIVHPIRLAAIGHLPSPTQNPVSATTASGVVTMVPVTITAIEALGVDRNNFTVMAHALPKTAKLDGLLGLDFFRGQVLTIDFQKGEIVLDPGTTASATP
jgi:predicted aspartyl protease